MSFNFRWAKISDSDRHQHEGFKYLLDDGGWLCVRFSGTEPIMCFYVETTQDNKRHEILDAGLKLAGLK